MTGRAARADLPQLTRLWQTCFHDSEAEVQAFWKCFGDKIGIFCARDGKKVTAMLCALPVQLIDDAGDSHEAAYLYAVATDPAYRGRGLCGEILACAERALRAQGVEYAILVPAEPGLFALYERYGYKTAFFRGRGEISGAACAGKVEEIDADTYFSLRELLLVDSFVSCGPDYLTYQATTDRLMRIETAGQMHCAVCAQDGSELTVKELLPYTPEAAALLLKHFGCKCGRCLTPQGTLPYGMCKALSGAPLPQNCYLGLVLD